MDKQELPSEASYFLYKDKESSDTLWIDMGKGTANAERTQTGCIYNSSAMT